MVKKGNLSPTVVGVFVNENTENHSIKLLKLDVLKFLSDSDVFVHKMYSLFGNPLYGKKMSMTAINDQHFMIA